jgi:hypothetical protein
LFDVSEQHKSTVDVQTTAPPASRFRAGRELTIAAPRDIAAAASAMKD